MCVLSVEAATAAGADPLWSTRFRLTTLSAISAQFMGSGDSSSTLQMASIQVMCLSLLFVNCRRPIRLAGAAVPLRGRWRDAVVLGWLSPSSEAVKAGYLQKVDESPTWFRRFRLWAERSCPVKGRVRVCSLSAVVCYPLLGVGRPRGSSTRSSFGRVEFKVLYYLVVDKYSLGLLDLVLKPSVFVDPPHLAEKYLLRFRIEEANDSPVYRPPRTLPFLRWTRTKQCSPLPKK